MKTRNQKLRKQCLKRDNLTCQKCGLEDKSGKLLEVHHISPIFSNGKDELDNLITLCIDCHHFAPNKKEDFDDYMLEEMTGTATTLMEAIEKVREEDEDLFRKVGERL